MKEEFKKGFIELIKIFNWLFSLIEESEGGAGDFSTFLHFS
jgi:hypothetical protein